MFWSKIYFFLVAVAAAVAFTIALVMPRPAQRAIATEEKRRLTVACGVVRILLEGDALARVDLVGSFSRVPEIAVELESASAAASLDEARMKKLQGIAYVKMFDPKKGIQGPRKPDFAILLDKKGRVVARVQQAHGPDENEFGEVMAGRPLVDDALAGYLRDDLWVQSGTVYFISASPVVKGAEYVGAVVFGHKITNEFAKNLVGESLLVGLGFYFTADTVAATETITFDQSPMKAGLDLLKGPEIKDDCTNNINKQLTLQGGSDNYSGLIARLPGEAGSRGAYYSVFIKQPSAQGFGAALGEVTQEDLGFSNFPWILVGGGFLVILAGGIGLMLLESDRPLRRLAADTVRLAKSEAERLGEDIHPGKFGSIARSVNIHIDKLGREAKTAKKDLDQLLGPAPEGSLGTIDLLATALPSVRPGGPAPAVPPPPSEFRFGDSGSMPARPTPPARSTPAPGTPQVGFRQVATQPGIQPALSTPPQPFVAAPPPAAFGAAPQSFGAPPPLAPQAPLTLDEDILGGQTAIDPPEPPGQAAPRVDPYFKQVFDQFISVKKSCNEPTTGLTYEKFSEKLIKNRDDLKAKTGCREVRFTVYVKDGKAALKATPVKDE